MIWIIALLALALFVILTMCLLIIGSRADDRKEAFFINNLADKNGNNIIPASINRVTACMPLPSVPGVIHHSAAMSR
jgi:hypothetical protein